MNNPFFVIGTEAQVRALVESIVRLRLTQATNEDMIQSFVENLTDEDSK